MDLNLWKNKDELKQFLDNLGTEYRYGCYEEKRPEVCHLLGDYLLSIDKNGSKAARIYKSTCDDYKYGLSCDAYGRMAFRGTSMDGPNCRLALEYFIKGCELNDHRSCYHGGQMLGIVDKNVNKIIPPDPDKAIEMLTKSCQSKKQPSSCTLVHSFFLRGVHGKPPDMKKAAEFAEIACEQEEHMACFNLSRMYHLGEGVQADQEKSKYYLERAKTIKSGVTINIQTKMPSGSDLPGTPSGSK